MATPFKEGSDHKGKVPERNWRKRSLAHHSRSWSCVHSQFIGRHPENPEGDATKA